MEKFEEHMEDDVTCLYAAFPQKLMAGFTDVLKREYKAAGNITSMLKSLLAESEKRTLRDHCQLHVFLSKSRPQQLHLQVARFTSL